jgi:hypothetical protein
LQVAPEYKDEGGSHSESCKNIRATRRGVEIALQVFSH